MLTRKIGFLHMRLNSMDIRNINARLGKLGWVLRKTSKETLTHGKTKLELENFQFVGQGPTSQPCAVDSDQMKKRCYFHPTKAWGSHLYGLVPYREVLREQTWKFSSCVEGGKKNVPEGRRHWTREFQREDCVERKKEVGRKSIQRPKSTGFSTAWYKRTD